ncbi:MAG: acetyl-CoA carboxylase biotin carboxyl carrier protein [Pseudomonadota bacterium]
MAKRRVDVDLIRELAALLHETDLTEIEIGDDADRIRIARTVSSIPMQAPAAPQPPAPAPAAEAAPAPSAPSPAEGAVTCPMVGTAYLSSEPGAPPYVRVGDIVAEGDTLLIVEAMKVMNPITAPRAGKVEQILVENQQPVEFGEPLVVLS